MILMQTARWSVHEPSQVAGGCLGKRVRVSLRAGVALQVSKNHEFLKNEDFCRLNDEFCSPSDSNLKANLDGCLKKRMLESAKFVWLGALLLAVDVQSERAGLVSSQPVVTTT